MLRKSILTLALTLGVATSLTAQGALPKVPPPPKLDYDSLAFARQVTQWFLYADIDSLWAHSDTSLQTAYGGNKGMWADQVAQFALQLGQETGLVEERWVQRLGFRQYWRIIRLSEVPEPFAIRWVLLPGKKIRGMGINPANDLPPVDP